MTSDTTIYHSYIPNTTFWFYLLCLQSLQQSQRFPFHSGLYVGFEATIQFNKDRWIRFCTDVQPDVCAVCCFRPVPGSLSSLLHLRNRQRQPLPASMPGTLPDPTMPGSSAVLLPVSVTTDPRACSATYMN